jgi:hypothetical protein
MRLVNFSNPPVGNVDREMQRNKMLLDQHHIVHRQGLNEELAANATFGTQALHDVPGARYDGVFAMWFGKALPSSQPRRCRPARWCRTNPNTIRLSRNCAI